MYLWARQNCIKFLSDIFPFKYILICPKNFSVLTLLIIFLSIFKKFCLTSLKETHLGIILRHCSSIFALFEERSLYESSLKILNTLKMCSIVVYGFPFVIEKNKLWRKSSSKLSLIIFIFVWNDNLSIITLSVSCNGQL